MKKSQRLNVIVDLYVRQEREALEIMGTSQQRLADQQNQLDQLVQYRLEYLQRFEARQRAGINVGQLLEFRAFADKLDGAIEGQRRQVLQCERDLQKARGLWEQCHQRTKSLKRVKELAAVDEAKTEQKREQAEQDDRAARSRRDDGTGRA